MRPLFFLSLVSLALILSWVSSDVTAPYGSNIGIGDDDTPCSVPLANFSCPDYTTTITSSAVVVVWAWDNTECNAGGVGSYELTVSGAASNATLIDDDYVFP